MYSDGEEGSKRAGERISRLAELKARRLALKSKSASKLPTEKRHKDTYKRVKGNIQKSRSDLHVNKKTGKREITTDMVIHKGLTTKEKAGLKKSILNAVKKHLSGSGLHIPLIGGYTSSLIFHEMGKYIPPKDRKLMKKLIEESRPPRPPPIHSGAIDEEDAVAVVPPMDDYDHEARIRELNDSDSETDSEQERHEARIRELNDSDSDSDDDMYGSGFNPIEWGFKTAINKTEQGLKNVGNQYLDAAKRDLNRTRIVSKKAGTGLKKTKLHNNGIPHPVLKRPRGRPRKIQL
jgi:hypothetical protein